MTDWGLAFEIVGIGILSIAVVLSVVTFIMWLYGKLLQRFGGGKSANDKAIKEN